MIWKCDICDPMNIKCGRNTKHRVAKKSFAADDNWGRELADSFSDRYFHWPAASLCPITSLNLVFNLLNAQKEQDTRLVNFPWVILPNQCTKWMGVRSLCSITSQLYQWCQLVRARLKIEKLSFGCNSLQLLIKISPHKYILCLYSVFYFSPYIFLAASSLSNDWLQKLSCQQ